MTKLNAVSLEELMPHTLRRDQNVLNSARALDPELQALAGLSDMPAIFANLEKLTSKQLDHLGYSFDSAVWRDTWPVEVKRSMLIKIMREKRLRGTVSAVKEALNAVQSNAQIVEWWETTPKGTPHTFRIYVTQSAISGVVSADMQNDIIALIDDAKPLRSHYDLTIQEVVPSGVGVTAVARAATYSRVEGGI